MIARSRAMMQRPVLLVEGLVLKFHCEAQKLNSHEGVSNANLSNPAMPVNGIVQ